MSGEFQGSLAALPKMSAQERADLSRMAHRNFSSDLDAYRFWHELVTTAAFFHVFEQIVPGRKS